MRSDALPRIPGWACCAVCGERRSQYAGFLVHLGFSVWPLESPDRPWARRHQEVELQQGQIVQWGQRSIRLDAMVDRQLPDKLVAEAVLEVSAHRGRTSLRSHRASTCIYCKTNGRPKLPFIPIGAAIFTRSCTAAPAQGRVSLTLIENPRMRWLWVGGIVMVLGADHFAMAKIAAPATAIRPQPPNPLPGRSNRCTEQLRPTFIAECPGQGRPLAKHSGLRRVAAEPTIGPAADEGAATRGSQRPDDDRKLMPFEQAAWPRHITTFRCCGRSISKSRWESRSPSWAPMELVKRPFCDASRELSDWDEGQLWLHGKRVHGSCMPRRNGRSRNMRHDRPCMPTLSEPDLARKSPVCRPHDRPPTAATDRPAAGLNRSDLCGPCGLASPRHLPRHAAAGIHRPRFDPPARHHLHG